MGDELVSSIPLTLAVAIIPYLRYSDKAALTLQSISRQSIKPRATGDRSSRPNRVRARHFSVWPGGIILFTIYTTPSTEFQPSYIAIRIAIFMKAATFAILPLPTSLSVASIILL